jgi:uncharacterized protein (DUF58 family)
VGAAFYSDRVEWFLPPRSSRRQALRIVSQVLEFEPVGQGTDLPATLDFLEPLLRRRSAVVLISDFLDRAQWPALDRLAHRHDVIAVQLTDPRERELPAVGLVTLWDPESGRHAVIDADEPDVREGFRAARLAFDEELRAFCGHRGIDLLRLDTDQPYADRLAAFFSGRERRRR